MSKNHSQLGEPVPANKIMFKCKHPFDRLHIEKTHTIKRIDDDFREVTYYFRCFKCGCLLEKGFAKTIGGVNRFLERGRKRASIRPAPPEKK